MRPAEPEGFHSCLLPCLLIFVKFRAAGKVNCVLSPAFERVSDQNHDQRVRILCGAVEWITGPTLTISSASRRRSHVGVESSRGASPRQPPTPATSAANTQQRPRGGA
jgi:hypothetical protein